MQILFELKLYLFGAKILKCMNKSIHEILDLFTYIMDKPFNIKSVTIKREETGINPDYPFNPNDPRSVLTHAHLLLVNPDSMDNE